MTDLLVSIAISGISQGTLRQIRSRMQVRTRQWVRDALERLEAEREPFDDILVRDRDYYATWGEIPDTLLSLTPQPYPKLPVDPYTDRPFVYRRLEGTSFYLYSTGPIMTDGGGQFGPWPGVSVGRADLCLDANDYWSDC